MDLSLQAISSGSHLDEPSLLSSPPVSSVCPFFSPFHENFLEQTRYQIVTMIIGQDTRRNAVVDVTIGTGAFRTALKLFSQASRRRFRERTTNEGHLFSREKAFALISSRFFENWMSQLDDLLYKYIAHAITYIIYVNHQVVEENYYNNFYDKRIIKICEEGIEFNKDILLLSGANRAETFQFCIAVLYVISLAPT